MKPITYGRLVDAECTDGAVTQGGDPARGAQFHRLSTASGMGVVIVCVTSKRRYSGGAIPSASMDSNRVDFFRNARLILPVGPLRCLAIMISARPSSSGSSGL